MTRSRVNALFRHQIVANNDAFCRAGVFRAKPRPTAARRRRTRRSRPPGLTRAPAAPVGLCAPPCVTGLPLFTAVCVTMFANPADAAAAADEDAPAAAAAGAADQDARGLERE